MSKASQESDQQVSDEQGPRAYLGVQPTLANVEAWMANVEEPEAIFSSHGC